MSKFPSVFVSVYVGLLVVFLGAWPAQAADLSGSAGEAVVPSDAAAGLRAGDWLVRGRIMGMIPTEQRSRISLIGGRLETPAAILPDFDITYFLSDHVAIAAQAGATRTRPAIRNSRIGDVEIGSIWSAAALGSVQYHFLPGARLNPYLGIGVSATTPLSIEPARGIPNFKVKTQASPLLEAGFDYHIAGNWFGNAMVKYIFIPRQSYSIGGVDVQVDMSMLIVGAGLGYRF